MPRCLPSVSVVRGGPWSASCGDTQLPGPQVLKSVCSRSGSPPQREGRTTGRLSRPQNFKAENRGAPRSICTTTAPPGRNALPEHFARAVEDRRRRRWCVLRDTSIWQSPSPRGSVLPLVVQRNGVRKPCVGWSIGGELSYVEEGQVGR